MTPGSRLAASIARTFDSLPPADDRLYPPHAYGAGWLVVGIAALLVAVAGLAWALRPSRPAAIAAEPEPVVDLRRSYLKQLDDLERQLIDRHLTPRALHHELSRTLRRFADDAGAVGAQAMSPGSLDAAGLKPIATAVRTYERPQFDALPNGEPFAALGLARAIISSTTAADLAEPRSSG